MNHRLRKSIKQILLAGSTFAFSASVLAVVGQQNPPPGPGQIPDYFGVVPNFATSPQPILATVTITDTGGGIGAIAAATTYDYSTDKLTDTVMDVQVLEGGSGYSANTTVTINGGPGVVTPAQVVPVIENGVIRSFTITNPGAGYKTPIAGSGIRKFMDSLPNIDTPNNLGQNMPLAVPDKTTFPNSDYYEIAEVEYLQKMHSDLPATHLRGYVQIKTGGFTLAGFNAAADKLKYASQYAGYLGPVIVAEKDRPVRVKLVNLLSTGAAGNLPIPVDHTYMGADGATDTDNRTALHMHGGNTPWISDGTPRQWIKPKGEIGPNRGESARDVPDMWFDATGAVVTSCAGKPTCNVGGASNYPGDGALTYFFTNEQTARLMFYHDHAEGTTRLNVYAGLAAGYVLQDSTEKALMADGTLPADTIPLIIQEKTFIPDDTTPVLNFYGPFKSALNSQDPTWRWGTGTAATGKMGNGDLWVPHVFMPNQNPGDVTGANSMGRWDYGAWFWPPFAGLQNGPLPNPYYDPNCDTTTQYCEGPEIPGVPNGSLKSVLSNGIPGGVPDINNGGAITESPSATPEAFNDTPVVNGTAYPYVNVDPKKYRLRILSVGNDRMLNLSLVMAASKNAASTSLANAGPSASAPAVLCDGNNQVDPADCTEVKMVPFDSTQDTFTPFPSHWYSPQKGGVTFDGRPGGVFDPTTRGPVMVQVGTEGGFLPTPVVIPNQPVNYEYNPKNILIGNIKEHALLLGNAERADVVVDFSNFAGSTLILYNDAPAPVPAWDLRLDYYTGNSDNTDTGGAFSVIPGYGPNSRTLMQFRVSGAGGSHPVDDLGSIDMKALTSKVQAAFKSSQDPIIVPQSVYNPAYGMNAPDALGSNLSRISDTALSFQPYNPATGLFDPKVTLEMEPKTIIEDWTMSWGRMNALLGTEVPHTTAINQTSIPQAYIDPPTELVKITPNDNMVPVTGTLPDGTQIWKITHNGVDSHAVHFHLFNVQLVNRVGWDGAVYPPDANELGWKDTVRMNPLSDVIVALRPMKMRALPFKVPNSHRANAPAIGMGAKSPHAFNFNPMTGNASNVTNMEVNYGWEYIWHCHLLGHEENDMMRAIAVAQPPEKPLNLTATTTGTGASQKVVLNWIDDSIISNWVTIQRSFDNFKTVDSSVNVVFPECALQNGCARSHTVTVPQNTTVSYRVMANNTVGAGDGKLDAPRKPDGTYGDTLPAELSSLTPGFDGFGNVTANSDWSNVATRVATQTAKVTPLGPLTFPNTNVGATSPVNTSVTLENVGTSALVVNKAVAIVGSFARSGGTCTSGTTGTFSLAVGAKCTIGLTFKPTSACANLGANGCTGSVTITNNSGGIAGSTQSVALQGTGVVLMPTATVTPANVNFANTVAGSTSAVTMVTLQNTGNGAMTVNNAKPFTGPFARATGTSAGTCSTTATGTSTLAAGASCTVGVVFKPTQSGAATGTLVFTDNSGNVANSTQTVTLSGRGTAFPMTANPDVATAIANTTTTQTVSVNVRDNDIPLNTGTVAMVSLSKTATANAKVTVVNNNIVLNMTGTGATTAARQASKRGVYTVTYSLTANGTRVQSTATITVN